MAVEKNRITAICCCFLIILAIFSAVQVFGGLQTVSPLGRLRVQDNQLGYDGPLDPGVASFYEQVFNSAIPPPLELPALKSECASTSWIPNLYFECILLGGGLTTLIGQVKVCIHMSIEIGANLIIPTTPSRGATDLTEWDNEDRKPLGLWFDRAHLITRLGTTCPQMTIAKLKASQQPDLAVAKVIEMDYSKAPFSWGFGPYEIEGANWKEWFLDRVATEAPQEQGNIVLRAPTPSQFFNVTNPEKHNQTAWAELGSLLRARPIPRQVISKIRDSMRDRSGNVKPYIGVHFRAEDDVNHAHDWSSPEVQIERILKSVEEIRRTYRYSESVPRIMYIACGDEEQLNNLKRRAQAIGWTTLDKWSMAQSIGQDVVDLIHELDFDHEAMIDMGMLLISDFFLGLGASAFSFTIAHDRSPTGRYLGSSLDADLVAQDVRVFNARSHLYEDGGFAYQCCL